METIWVFYKWQQNMTLKQIGTTLLLTFVLYKSPWNNISSSYPKFVDY